MPHGEHTMRSKTLRRAGSFAIVALLGLYLVPSSVRGQSQTLETAAPAEIRRFFQGAGKTVLTFVGYSGAGYEDPRAMLDAAERILGEFAPEKTIVNIGATPDGIGTVYELAKRKGFLTTGIVSTQAKQYKAALSPFVDHVFYVEDATWGGYLKGTKQLSPTSAAMVENSSVIIGIGGGEVGRDELLEARRVGKKVRFLPADMNHQKAIEAARRKGLPVPTDFRGAAQTVF
jgi:hypothetical protein